MMLRERSDVVGDAIAALTGEQWSITEAANHVPSRPGLYAIFGDGTAWLALVLEPRTELPLYVGKAKHSLVTRKLNGHFAERPSILPRTGSSTVRRSFAALLSDALDLHAAPRNISKPERFANYDLAEDGNTRLSTWMHQRLSLAVWEAPDGRASSLNDVETAVIEMFMPPVNVAKNPGKLARLRRARAAMVADAPRWQAATSRWLYEPSSDGSGRFVHGVAGSNLLVCFGIDPSTAKPGDLDPTVTRVRNFAAAHRYDSWTMLNVHPQVSTQPSGMHHPQDDPQLKAANEQHIGAAIQARPTMLAAWGARIARRPCLPELLRAILGLTNRSVALSRLALAGRASAALVSSRERHAFVPFNMNAYRWAH